MKASNYKALSRKIFLSRPELVPGRVNRTLKPVEVSASNQRPQNWDLNVYLIPPPSVPVMKPRPKKCSEVLSVPSGFPVLAPVLFPPHPPTSETRLDEVTGLSLLPS